MNAMTYGRGLKVALVILVIQAFALTKFAYAGAPSASLIPEQVVADQLTQLKNNAAGDLGIATAYAYASPTFKTTYPTLASWTSMLKNTVNHSNTMLNSYSFVPRPILNYGYTAYQSVTVTSPTGKVVDFLFTLGKQTYGPCTGCWLTDSITVQSVSYVTPPTPPAAVAPTIDGFGVSVSGSSATFSGTASDANSNLSSIKIELDGSASLFTVTPTSTGVWTYTASSLSSGSHTFRARAVDSGGLQSAWTSLSTFNIGSTTAVPPTLDSISVAVSGQTAIVSGTASDANNNLASVQVEVDGSATLFNVTPTSSGSWSYTASSLSVGNHTFRARATDAGGLQSAWSATQNVNVTNSEACDASHVDMTKINAAVNWVATNYNYIDSMLIKHCDTLLTENYYNGFNANTLHEIQSATKTFSSTLVGILLRKGVITSLDQKISELLPNYSSLFVGGRENITVRHLLTMTTGLRWNDFTPPTSFDEINAASDSINYVLTRTLETTPGAKFAYNTGSSHLLSAIVKVKTGMSTDKYAEQELFGPLGISTYTWPKLKDGINQGGWGMYMKPIDFIKLAQLYRNGGVWNGTQILDKSFADAAIVKQVVTGNTLENYGFQMWIEEDYGTAVVAGARGYGGQDSLVAKAQGYTIVFTGSIQQPTQMATDIKNLIKNYIVPSHVGAAH